MVVSARDIKKKASFETIRLKILEYAKSAVDEARRAMTETNTEDEDEDEDEDDDGGDDNESIPEGGESTDDESETVEEVPPELVPRHLIKDYKFGLIEFNLLTERLAYQMEDFIIKLDLFDGYLAIRTVPRGSLHGIAVGVFTEILIWWARDPNTPGIQGNPLRGASDASMCLSVLSLNFHRLLLRKSLHKIP